MKKLLLIILGLLLVIPASAQEYTADAELLSDNGSTIVVVSSGMHKQKKKAVEMAVRSAFYTYLTAGIDGVSDSKPLIDPKLVETEFAVQNYINSMVETRYNNFVGEYTELSNERTFNKMYKAQVRLQIYKDALVKDVANQGYGTKSTEDMTLRDTGEEMLMPTIMVVPRTEDGVTIKEAMDNDPEYRAVIAKIAQAFLDEGVETKNFDEMYDALSRTEALAPTMSNEDVILSMGSKGVDVVVYADIRTHNSNNGLSVNLSLTAVDAATRSTLAAVNESSKPFRGSSVSTLSGLLTEAIAPTFMEQISTSFARNTTRGQGISIRFSLDPNSSADFSTELSSDGLTIGDITRLWIKENAKGGKYRIATQTPTLLIYDQIYIPTQSEGGGYADVNDFELELRQYMREQGVVIANRLLNGNEILYTLTY